MPQRILRFIREGEPDVGEIITASLNIGRGAWLLIPGRENLPAEAMTHALRSTHLPAPEQFFGTLFLIFGMAQLLSWATGNRRLRKNFAFCGWTTWLFLLVMYLLTNPLSPGVPGAFVMSGIGLWIFWRI